jgi:hypothetical protein
MNDTHWIGSIIIEQWKSQRLHLQFGTLMQRFMEWSQFSKENSGRCVLIQNQSQIVRKSILRLA